jgi:hypothetical protein
VPIRSYTGNLFILMRQQDVGVTLLLRFLWEAMDNTIMATVIIKIIKENIMQYRKLTVCNNVITVLIAVLLGTSC